MARNMNISFLGTSSGGGPSISRNCSSLGMKFHFVTFHSQTSWATARYGVRFISLALDLLN
ncbi:hypothetical protein F4604DRAFT_1741202 [Suillus subluteus]|nr:hypothetical protein F4604DRAFT_1741202 [Suillus subluteus]